MTDRVKLLHDEIEKDSRDLLKFGKLPYELPSYIHDNLRHDIRRYQEEALQRLIYTQRDPHANDKYNYLLFNMATGSGKTLVMAASILSLYKEQGYQNFIFFVNSTAITEKTKDNLIKQDSPKYLFNKDGIVIDGERINIEMVSGFPVNPNKNTIYIMIITVQELHGSLEEPKENQFSYDKLKGRDVVLLGDEAHHYFAETKNSKGAKEKSRGWESTIDEILAFNPANRMLGYSATFELSNEALAKKIKDRILIKYDLSDFMGEGYSKNVILLQTKEHDNSKMLNAILLSQYRKYIAYEHGIYLKPIILFKSNSIPKSIETHKDFNDMIENLSGNQLREIIKKSLLIHTDKSSIWYKVFNYYKNQDLDKVVRDLKWDFDEDKTFNANGEDMVNGKNVHVLNTLEEPDNHVRSIFAVAKLNEGWDVLNLYDIVRISEGTSTGKGTTNSEAQLIGRGARYYPFAVDGEKSYKRRYDDVSSDLKVIESLHYHTINDNAYIKNLHESLKEADIRVQEDNVKPVKVKMKKSFKKSDLYKKGKVFVNQVTLPSEDEYQTLIDYGVNLSYEGEYRTSEEGLFDADRSQFIVTDTHEVEMKVEKRILEKAIQRNPFFQYDRLKTYMPYMESLEEFIESDKFLGGVKFYIKLPQGLTIDDLTAKEKLRYVDDFLNKAKTKIQTNFMKPKGKPVFEGIDIKDVIVDYELELNKINEKVRHMDSGITSREIKGEWFAFDKAVANPLEHRMIDFVSDYINKLEDRYEEVFLIRNEHLSRAKKKVKIHEIDGSRGFMPDFLLYLKNKNITYQVFLEPKGAGFRKGDEWKERFLEFLSKSNQYEVLTEGDDFRLIGIKFYTEDQSEFRKDFTKKLMHD